MSMNQQSIEIRIIRETSALDMIALYKDAGWWEAGDDILEEHTQFVEKIPRCSFVFAGAFDGSTMIGMGRALSDGISDAYIQDVTVLKKYRGKGIGKMIIRALTDELQKRGLAWIALVAEPGTTPFYESLGFKPMENYVPMKFQQEKK